MNKLERLLDLIAALLHAERPLSAEDLRRRLGSDAYSEDKAAFRRAFERDKELLRSLGVPLEVVPVPFTDPPEDGYRIDKKRYAAKRRFEPEELRALRLAADLVKLDGSRSGLARLGAAGDSDAGALGRLDYHEANDVLIPAAADRTAVSLRYNGVDRVVEPWVVGFSRGHWYFVGFDRLRQARRTFRVDRIAGAVTPAGEATEPVGELHEPFAFRPWQFPEAPPVEARLAVDADRVGMARSLFRLGDDDLEPFGDGRMTARLVVSNPPGLRYALLELGEGAELLEPPELRAEMIAWLEAML